MLGDDTKHMHWYLPGARIYIELLAKAEQST